RADREAGQVAVGQRGGVLDRLGQGAEARAEDEAEARRRGARARGVADHVGGGGHFCASSRSKASGSSSARVTVRRTPSGPLRWILVSLPANSDKRWRQPPHGTISSVSAMTTASSMRCPPPVTSAPIAEASAHWPCG